MLLTLFDSSGQVKATFSPNDSSTQDKEIQGDNLLKLSFILYECISIDVNDYLDYDGERYWATEKYKPAQKSTMEWEYSFQLRGIESLISHRSHAPYCEEYQCWHGRTAELQSWCS